MFKPIVRKGNEKQIEITTNFWYYVALIFEISYLVNFWFFIKNPNLLTFGLGTWFLLISLTLHIMILIVDFNASVMKK